MHTFAVLLLAVLVGPGAGAVRGQSVGIDIGVDVPVFLGRVPFSVASGPHTVSGFISVYFHATRNVKVVGGGGHRYRANYSVTTFMYCAEYTSSLWGGAVTQQSQDTIYVSRIEATIRSLDVAAVAAVE
ncbi:hypothetical protein IWQ57_001280 [Coemansia nantahalensis]|uniref:Uncharacterized protein n=1 Tax=Coemansia nantahalensis TaxID=2789366 RepID=A0ACC1K574_9FUNG|nr:hypothetical protein IWQ57_001280 [Coemansia nantahalensis]